jgi:cytochrome d ubiquinol oxidase subunit II
VTIAATVALFFLSLFPDVMPSSLNSAWSLTVSNASATPYTLRIMTWCAAIATPLVLLYQGWTYWVFRKRIGTQHIAAAHGVEGVH